MQQMTRVENKLLINHNHAAIQNGSTLKRQVSEMFVTECLHAMKTDIHILAEAEDFVPLPLFRRKCKIVATKTINLPDVDGLAIFNFSTCSLCVCKRNLGVNFNYTYLIYEK